MAYSYSVNSGILNNLGEIFVPVVQCGNIRCNDECVIGGNVTFFDTDAEFIHANQIFGNVIHAENFIVANLTYEEIQNSNIINSNIINVNDVLNVSYQLNGNNIQTQNLNVDYQLNGNNIQTQNLNVDFELNGNVINNTSQTIDDDYIRLSKTGISIAGKDDAVKFPIFKMTGTSFFGSTWQALQIYPAVNCVAIGVGEASGRHQEVASTGSILKIGDAGNFNDTILIDTRSSVKSTTFLGPVYGINANLSGNLDVQKDINLIGNINNYKLPSLPPFNNFVLTSNTSGQMAWRSLSNGFFSATSNGPTITTTTAETTIISLANGVGTLTIPANFVQPGDSFHVRLSGTLNTNNGDNVTIRIKALNPVIGVLISAIVQPFSSTAIGRVWELESDFTFRNNGASASLFNNTTFTYSLGSPSFNFEGQNSNASASLDATQSMTLEITAQFNSASTNNSIVCVMANITKTY